VTTDGEPAPVLRALIASRVRVYREALAEVLSRSPCLRVIGTAERVDEILQQLSRGPLDIVLIDTTLSDSPGTVREIRQQAREVKVVAIATPATEEDVVRLAEAGVAGYVLPDGSVEELIVALESAARGELRVSPSVAYRLLRRLGSLASLVQGKEHGPPMRLTAREREVIQLVHNGMSNTEIAQRLGVQVGTAKNHVQNILKKLHVHRRIDAAEWYRQAGSTSGWRGNGESRRADR
jgi:two-component system, NarL family, nitrate/nitrite response regulator NarL